MLPCGALWLFGYGSRPIVSQYEIQLLLQISRDPMSATAKPPERLRHCRVCGCGKIKTAAHLAIPSMQRDESSMQPFPRRD